MSTVEVNEVSAGQLAELKTQTGFTYCALVARAVGALHQRLVGSPV